MTPYRITVFLDNGTAQVTEESFSVGEYMATHDTPEDGVIGELIERIEDREDPWKTFGHLTFNFRHINGFAVEAIPTGGTS